MPGKIIYKEQFSSTITLIFFLGLAFLFLLLLIGRLTAQGMDDLAGILIGFCGFFLFYAKKFRILMILLTSESLSLKFGIFNLVVPLNNIEECYLNHLPPLMKFGGAGVHYMFMGKKYRISFNFLEHPRVAVVLKHKQELVEEVSFSTCSPEVFLKKLKENLSTAPSL